MLDFLRTYQLNLMLALSGMCGLVALFVFLTKFSSYKRKLSLLQVELCSMLLLMSERFSYVYRGNVSQLGYWMVRISNFCVFFFTLMDVYFFNEYLTDLFTHEGKLKNTPKALFVARYLLVIGEALIILNLFTGIYYTFDESNHYTRSHFYIICYVIPLIVLTLQLYVILKYYDNLRRGIRMSLLLFSGVPIMVSIMQIFAYGLSLTSISVVAMAILLYIFALRDMNTAIEEANEMRIKYLEEKHESSRRLFEQTATALVNAIDAKDKYTHGHSSRVAEYSRKIAEEYGKSEKECDEIYYAALLHDVGKIGIPQSILNKEGKLTDEEFDAIKQHPVFGDQILSSISEYSYLSIGAKHHHERYDGKGYPDKLKAEDIPEIARIISVADAYDAMTSKRSYRDPIPQQKVREELIKGSGTQFDPEFAKIMLHLIDLDSEYDMKEKVEVKELEGKNELVLDKHRSDISEGIIIIRNITNIHMKCTLNKEQLQRNGMPSLLLFDSLDGRVYTDEKLIKDLSYFEYGELWIDGRYECKGARKIQVEDISGAEVSNEQTQKKAEDNKYIYECDIQAVKYKDHAMVTISTDERAIRVIIALPDSSRYLYMGLTGEYCKIGDVSINKNKEAIDENYIPRIAEEISFINVPAGDIPNVQIDGYRTDCTEGILIRDGLKIRFHTMSLPTARLVWHCPFFSIFYSQDRKIGGPDYKEFALIHIDGENWDSEEISDNKLLVNKSDEFNNWETWKEKNKEGFDCEAEFHIDGNRIITTTENAGISIKNVTTLKVDVKEVYVSLSGDQCALTDIRILEK